MIELLESNYLLQILHLNIYTGHGNMAREKKTNQKQTNPQKLLCTEELLFGLMNCRPNFLPSTDVTRTFKIYLLPLKTHKSWKILCTS